MPKLKTFVSDPIKAAGGSINFAFAQMGDAVEAVISENLSPLAVFALQMLDETDLLAGQAVEVMSKYIAGFSFYEKPRPLIQECLPYEHLQPAIDAVEATITSDSYAEIFKTRYGKTPAELFAEIGNNSGAQVAARKATMPKA